MRFDPEREFPVPMLSYSSVFEPEPLADDSKMLSSFCRGDSKISLSRLSATDSCGKDCDGIDIC